MMTQQPQVGLRNLTGLLLILAAIGSVPWVFYVGRPDTPSLYFFAVLMYGLLIFPYLILFIVNWFLNKTPKHSAIILLLSLLTISVAEAGFYYYFFLQAEGQYGLMLVIVPLIQIVMSLLTALIAWRLK